MPLPSPTDIIIPRKKRLIKNIPNLGGSFTLPPVIPVPTAVLIPPDEHKQQHFEEKNSDVQDLIEISLVIPPIEAAPEVIGFVNQEEKLVQPPPPVEVPDLTMEARIFIDNASPEAVLYKSLIKPLRKKEVLSEMQAELQAVTNEGKQEGVRLNQGFFPLVTADRHQFNTKLLIHGENIFLEPTSLILKALYQELNKRLKINNDKETFNILSLVKEFTRHCFSVGNIPLTVEDKFYSISYFIYTGRGDDKQHSLLNAYFLSRLIDDNLLKGEISYHQEPNLGSAWTIFHDVESQIYTLDSFKDTLAMMPSKEAYDKHQLFSETLINIHDILEAIKREHFKVGYTNGVFGEGVVIEINDGAPRKKRVPHRVAAIYKLIEMNKDNMSDSESVAVLWDAIQNHARDGKLNPRRAQAAATSEFYQSILNRQGEISIDTLELSPDKVERTGCC
ncbi:MAG: hypothetical protein H0U75_03335 [Legionella sp.]|nr:hypothetical protein [Legionella sp.]